MPAPITTNPTSADITASSAILGGEITSDGGEAITGSGVVFALKSTNTDPRINGTLVARSGTAAVGIFAVSVAGLQSGKEYAFAAYASNRAGTSYTAVATFTTATDPSVAPTSLPTAARAHSVAPNSGSIGGEPTTPTLAQAHTLVGKSEHFLLRMVKSMATLPALASVVLLSLIAVVGLFVSKNPASGDPVNYARGLITVLFATGTLAIAFILAVSALLSTSADFERRFDKGKEILTIMIGIFGTILGFYFGTGMSVTPPESIKLSLSGPSDPIPFKKGETKAIKISLKQSGGKYTGNVKLTIESRPAGIETEFSSDTISPAGTGEVDLKVTVKDTAKADTHTLRVIGTPDSGTVSPVDVKIKVAE